MATTTQSQYRHEQRRTAGQPVQISGQPAHTTNWDDHLDGLLTDLKESLPAGRGPPPQSAAGSPLPLSADLTVPDDLAGSEDFHERREFTDPDRRTHTVQERSRRTERIDGGSQVVSRKVVRSQSRSRTTERSTVSPEPTLCLTADGVDSTGLNGFIERNETSTLNNTTPSMHDFNSRLSPMDLPAIEVPSVPSVPGSQSHVTRYEYRTSQRSVSPAPPRRQPPPLLPKPPPPSSLTLLDATTTAATTEQAPPRRQPPPPSSLTLLDVSTTAATTEQAPPAGSTAPAATTINYHIYNYGSEVPPLADSGVGTLERAGRRWQDSSMERRVVREGSASGQLGRPPSPCPAGERLYSRSVTTQVESTATQQGTGGGAAYPAQGETMVTRERRTAGDGGGGAAPFPMDTVDRTVRDAAEQTSVHVPYDPQDGTYPGGPRRRDLGSGQVTEVRSAQVVTEPSETASDLGHTLTAQGQSQGQSMAPGVYYPPSEQMNCETKFHSKEKGKEGNTRRHFEASGKYKAKGGSKQKEAKGGKTIPVCLPCCAGAACTIM